MEERIRKLLECYPLEEAFEVLDITPEDVISILIRQGYVELPEWTN